MFGQQSQTICSGSGSQCTIASTLENYTQHVLNCWIIIDNQNGCRGGKITWAHRTAGPALGRDRKPDSHDRAGSAAHHPLGSAAKDQVIKTGAAVGADHDQ